MPKKLWIIVLIVIGLMALPTFAQPGGGGPGGGGGPAGGGGIPGSGPNPGAILEELLGDDWSNFTLPMDEIPTSAEDVMALLEESGSDFDLESMIMDSVDFGEVSPEAYAAIVGFAKSYLGKRGLDPIIAMDIPTEEIADTATTASGDAETSLPIDQIMNQLPDEVQLILAATTGTGYWGIFSEGGAVVYTGIGCEGDGCEISMDNLQFNITSASLGAYAFYSKETVSNASQALSLITDTFPALAGKNLTATEASTGYAFKAVNVTSTSSAEAYYAGVITSDAISIVYVAGGVGEGYADMFGSP